MNIVGKILAVETGVAVNNQTSFQGYMQYIEAVYGFAIKAGAALSVLMIIYAGFKYLSSQGNPSAINEAKDIIIGTLSGFAMLLLVYYLLTILNMPKH